jgi:hypothetical protein
MDTRLPLDKEVLDRAPPEVIRLLLKLLARIEKLEAENARLKQKSSNSSNPPSSDPPGPKRKPPQPKRGRARAVTLTIPFRQVTWLGTPFLFQNVSVTGSATMSSERP